MNVKSNYSRLTLAALVMLAALLPASLALASDVSDAQYKAQIRITNADTATSGAAVFDLNTAGLIDSGMAESDLSDIAVQSAAGTDVRYMPGWDGDPWNIYVPAIGDYAQQYDYLYTGGVTGGTPAYFPAAGGMTCADSPTLEPGNSFQFDIYGLPSLTGGASRYIVGKTDAITIDAITTDTITATYYIVGNYSGYSTTSDATAARWSVDNTYPPAHNEATARAVTSAAVGTVGQNYSGWYDVYRTFLYFDTSSIPDDAIISSAILSIYGKTDYSTTDFNLVVQNGQPTYPHDPAVAGDYLYTQYTGDGGSINTSAYTTVGYNDIVLNATGRSWLDLSGTTKFAIISSRDISATQPSNSEMVEFYLADQAGEANDPKLVISYTNQVSVSAAGLSSAEHIRLTADTTDLKLYIDDMDTPVDTASMGGTSVIDNANGWAVGTNGSMIYIDHYQLTVGGVLVQDISYEYAATFTDASGHGQDMTPAFRTTASDADLTAEIVSFTPLLSGSTPPAAGAAQWEIIEDEIPEPPNLYGESEPDFFGAGWVATAAAATELPGWLGALIYAFGLALALGLIAYRVSMGSFRAPDGSVQPLNRGSVLVQSLVSGVVMVYFVATGDGVIPAWVLLPFGLEAIAAIMHRSSYDHW